MCRYLYLVVILFLPPFIFAQDWHFEAHSNNIAAITTDSDWVWLATRGGIFRLDPLDGSFTRYTKNDWLSDNYMTDILVTPEDSVWVGYYYYGCGKADTAGLGAENFEAVFSPMTSNFVRTMEVAPSGEIYIGTYYGGVVLYKDGQWRYLNAENSDLPITNYSGGVLSIAFESDTSDVNAWFGTKNHGLYHRSQDSTWTYFNMDNSIFPDNHITSLGIDEDKRVWVGTFNGLVVKDGNEWHLFQKNNSPLLFSAVYDVVVGDSIVWVATFQGVVKIPKDSYADFDSWVVYTEDNSPLLQNYVNRLAYDSLSGDLWVGTYSNGLMRFDGEEWDVFDIRESEIVDNDISILSFSKDSTLLVPTHTNGIGLFKDSVWIVLNEDYGLPNNYVVGAEKDTSNNLWMAFVYNGLSMWNGDSIVNYNHLNSPLVNPYNTFHDIYIDDENTIWLAASFGFWEINIADSSWVFHETNDDVLLIESDNAGGIWMGGYLTGLKHYQDGEIENYDTPDGKLSTLRVTDLVLDQWQNLWVATTDGLFKKDPIGNWFEFDYLNSGLDGNSILALEYTSDSTLWVSVSGNGVYSYKLGFWENFNQHDGFLPQNSINSMAWDPTGTLWLGTLQMGLGAHQITIYTTPEDSMVVNTSTPVQESLTILPNPVKENTQINLELSETGVGMLAIYSMEGRLIKEVALGLLPSGKNTYQLDVASLPSGNYYLQVYFNGHKFGELLRKE